MTDEAGTAFDHPEARARARATAGGAPVDRISLRDHVVAVEIGAFQVERDVAQRLSFDIVVEVRAPDGPLDDDVDRILSYDRITQAIADTLAQDRLDLLETLAERVAGRILTQPQAVRVFVRIQKLDRGPGALGVEIERTGGGAGHLSTGPAPRIVAVAAGAIAGHALSARIDGWTADGAPLILCPPLATGPRPGGVGAAVQRRINLLSMDQAAWALAAGDARCVVVATRTELDWAMRHGRVSVWAPSRIVVDAVDGPGPGPNDPATLAAWLSRRLGARELIVADGDGDATA